MPRGVAPPEARGRAARRRRARGAAAAATAAAAYASLARVASSADLAFSRALSALASSFLRRAKSSSSTWGREGAGAGRRVRGRRTLKGVRLAGVVGCCVHESAGQLLSFPESAATGAHSPWPGVPPLGQGRCCAHHGEELLLGGRHLLPGRLGEGVGHRIDVKAQGAHLGQAGRQAGGAQPASRLSPTLLPRVQLRAWL